MANKSKEFLVSTADFALYYNDILACTGTTNLNSSIEVSMEEQDINAGKGNKLVYSYKYGRQLTISLEAADWRLEYIALQTGSDIEEGLKDCYRISKCYQATEGIVMLAEKPIGDVAVELPNGTIVTVTPDELKVDLTDKGVTNEMVNVTYKFSNQGKQLTIDSETSPKVFKLVLDADKHSNKLGKIGSVQIEVPSYQPSGNFSMSFTPDGVTSTAIDGKALAVESDTCSDGGDVYAYVREFNDMQSAVTVADIAATPAFVNLKVGDTKQITVIGLKGALHSTVAVDNGDCTFEDESTGIVSVSADGIITAETAGSAKITVSYEGHKDVIIVEVED